MVRAALHEPYLGESDKKLTTTLFAAVLGSLAFLVRTPAAVLIARFGRDRISWFPPHWVLNLLSVILVIVTFALGTHARGNGWSTTHERFVT